MFQPNRSARESLSLFRRLRETGILAVLTMLLALCSCSMDDPKRPVGPDRAPDSWMFAQRAFPYETINYALHREEALRVSESLAHRSIGEEPWQSAGPVNIGGRINTLAAHPQDASIVYAGTSAGGVYKTVDGGATWTIAFEEPGALSIGDIAIATGNPDIVYVGTGEPNASATSGAFFGNGIYRSDNGGVDWRHLGLSESHHVGRIVVDPADHDRVFVAATGYLYGKNEERGVFRSLDGGSSWERVLFVSDSTACIDIAMDPVHTDTLYTAMWERLRYPHERDYAGVTTGVYRTFDGGETWQEIAADLNVPREERGRIGLAVSPSDPKTLYLSLTRDPVSNRFAGVYRSNDYGSTWERTDDGSLTQAYASFGWFFGNIRVHPESPEIVYLLGLNTHVSYDGGVSWELHTGQSVHVDQHAFIVHPDDPAVHVAGNDGGIYTSRSAGLEWAHVETMAISMFYTCAIDPSDPSRLYGGTQDNGTIRTPSGEPDEWEHILGGDGFYVIVDPTDPEIIYAEWQYGNLNRSLDGGVSWSWIRPPFDSVDRTNWNTPVVMDPNNPKVLYYGSSRIFRTKDRGETWEAISPDLTNHSQDVPGGPESGTISTIAVSPFDSMVLLVGTDDGHVQLTRNGGQTWSIVSDEMPTRYVTRVAFDPFSPITFYVTLSGYRNLDYQPHVLRSQDGGETWEDISGDLPEVPVNDILADPFIDSRLYIATDLGVWATNDPGGEWFILGEGLPLTIVNDLDIHVESRTLVAATFGRSLYTYELSQPTSIGPLEQAPAISWHVFPNPADGVLQVEIEAQVSGAAHLSLFDSKGNLVFNRKESISNAGRALIVANRTNLPAGAYWLKLEYGEYVGTKSIIFK